MKNAENVRAICKGLMLFIFSMWSVLLFAFPAPVFKASASGSTASLTLFVDLEVSDNDVGKNGNVYLVAKVGKVGDEWVANNGKGWVSWVGGPLPVFAAGALKDQTIDVLVSENLTPFIGTQVYVGYGTSESDMLVNEKYGLVHTVIPNSVEAGNTSSFALKVDGTLWAWGDNSLNIKNALRRRDQL